MLEQTLYDKDISVTLYRNLPQESETVPGYSASIVQGYLDLKLRRGKVLYNPNALTYDKDLGTTGTVPVTVQIQFYKGLHPRRFTGYQTGKGNTSYEVYEKIKYNGTTHNVDTIDEMKKGRAADGTVFKTGDRIRVKEDGSTWTTVIVESHRQNPSPGAGITDWVVEGDFGDTTLIKYPVETLHIENTEYGLKPDIALSINLLPGQNCYGAIVKIRNLNIDVDSIREWSRMVIRAGYRTGIKVQYTCPIFTSYIESPNPDGITVFEGITVGSADGILNNQMIEITFIQKEMTLLSLVSGVAKAISPDVTVNPLIADEIMNSKIKVSKQTVYAQNGMAVLSWLQSTTAEFVKMLTNGKTSVFVQLVDGRLDIIALNGPNKADAKIESVVDLDMVTGATFNGTALTVEAPWNPQLQPGMLFYMPPDFIYGSRLPNVLNVSDYRNEKNLYRALTISVAFATVENTNKMTVLAVPAQYADEMPTSMSTEMRGDLFARSLNESYKNVMGAPIQVGETSAVDTDDMKRVSKEDATNKQMYDRYGEDIITMWGSWVAFKIEAQPGDSLSMILERYLFTDPNGPLLTPRTKGKNKESSYYIPREDFEEDNNRLAIKHFQDSGCKANTVWWPLVTVGTYWRRRMDEKAGVSHNWNPAEPSNPDYIKTGYNLYVPVFSSWENMETKLKQLKDIFKYAYLEYKKDDLNKVWRAMYYYLGGTDVLN